MILYKFTLNYSNGQIKIYNKFCVHYKKTIIYKQCIKLLENDTLTSFSVSNN